MRTSDQYDNLATELLWQAANSEGLVADRSLKAAHVYAMLSVAAATREQTATLFAASQ